MSIHLFKHNQEAYNSVTAMLEREKMAAVIHPTGTGKSLIAFKLAEEHPSEKFLWLSPSEYIYQTQLENLGMEFDNIQFMSYSRLMKNEDSIETLHPDYIILDEFHRCGAAEWGKSVRKLLTACPDAKRLGLSATNIRYLDNQRNMAEEIFDGKIASEMTLGEAIVRGILPEPKYVIAMYSYKKELDQLKKRVQALSNQGLITENQKLLEQLRRALEQMDLQSPDKSKNKRAGSSTDKGAAGTACSTGHDLGQKYGEVGRILRSSTGILQTAWKSGCYGEICHRRRPPSWQMAVRYQQQGIR